MDDIKSTMMTPGLNGTAKSGNGHADKVAMAKEKAAEYLAVGKEKGSHYLELLENFVRTRPAAALGIAAGAGWLIGRLIKGRRRDED